MKPEPIPAHQSVEKQVSEDGFPFMDRSLT